MSLVSVACCQVEVSATGRSLVQRSPADCVCITECDQVQQETFAPPLGQNKKEDAVITCYKIYFSLLVIVQLAQIPFNVFIYLFIVLYMFRACRAHHQEK